MLEHEIAASRTSVVPFGMGLATIDHFEPFHASINVFTTRVVALSFAESPTAKQVVSVGQVIPFSSTTFAPLGLGLGTVVQLVPSLCSINGAEPSVVSLGPSPTAKQFAGLEHDTLASSPIGGPGGLGLGMTDHRGDVLDGAAVVTIGPAIRPATTISLVQRDRPVSRGRVDGFLAGRIRRILLLAAVAHGSAWSGFPSGGPGPATIRDHRQMGEPATP